MTDILLRLPRLTCKIIEISYVMAGFITMCILSHKSRSVMIHLLTLIGRGKKGIQLLFKGFRSSCQFHQGLDVMRNIPKVLPCISFGKRMPAVSTVLIRVERFDPFSLVILGLEDFVFGWKGSGNIRSVCGIADNRHPCSILQPVGQHTSHQKPAPE